MMPVTPSLPQLSPLSWLLAYFCRAALVTSGQGGQAMDIDDLFETALHTLAFAYTAPVIVLLVASIVGLAVIETLEEVRGL